MACANNNVAYYESYSQWVVKPLNRKGDLDNWLRRMHSACPNPLVGQIVWINGNRASTAYKALGFKPNGDVIWQRGEVVDH